MKTLINRVKRRLFERHLEKVRAKQKRHTGPRFMVDGEQTERIARRVVERAGFTHSRSNIKAWWCNGEE